MITLAQIQRRVGVAADGEWGPKTAQAIWEQLTVNDAITGQVGTGTVTIRASAAGSTTDSGNVAVGFRAHEPSDACFALIKQFEGCKLTAYPDPGSGNDPWTIGWGSTGPDIRRGVVWTQEQADARFAEHVAEFARGVAGLIGFAPTTQPQFDALVSFAYNVGLGNLGSSTLLRRHKVGDYRGAAAQFAVWNKAAGKVLPGLVRRRAAEAAMYRGVGS